MPRADAVASATRERAGLLLGLVLVLAAALFSLRLGHSSLFIDEVFSWNASRGDLSRLADSLRYSEVTPPLYYLLLYGWLHIAGSDSEIVMRVPSVLAGVGVVASIYWLGLLVAGRRGG
ncbi:MAG: mannosyltransferase, partial [Solirubrobacteraceae bacterium]|nr:mannosyltransferase [Solirubrobacteraceae bacterium]